MSAKATKFASRAPRYVLKPDDNRFMRYAMKDDQARSFTTRFLDISQTGLAFVTDPENAPHISDLIKVEIPLSDKETVAWWARVIRVEEYDSSKWYMKKEDFPDENQVRVAVTFHELPAGHVRLIQDKLNQKFNELYESERAQRRQNIARFLLDYLVKVIIYGALVAGTLWFLYSLSQPTINYDAKKGSPWGERFPEVMIHPDKDESAPEAK